MGLKKRLNQLKTHMSVRGKPKIFCIGCNKTGTTSLERALVDLGVVMGEQRRAEMLLEDWATGEFSRILSYCRTAQAFQDVPFSLPDTFKVVDQAFPGSRFILSVRDSSEQWYSSLVRFHGKMWADGRVPPTPDDLKNATYIYKGRPWDANRMIFDTPEDNPYEEQVLVDFYESYNASVLEYFKDRPADLLVINVAKQGAYQQLCRFLGEHSGRTEFPWENRTS